MVTRRSSASRYLKQLDAAGCAPLSRSRLRVAHRQGSPGAKEPRSFRRALQGA
jgi:hypothetical protein